MQEIKKFKGGGMDSDSAIQDIAPNDYLEAFNLRVTGTVEQEDGDGTSMESNELISGAKPSGLNKTLGTASFDDARKAYSFVYNSSKLNQITEFDYDTETETVIFENITDSGNVDILPLDPKYSVNQIKLLQGKYLIFNADNIQPGIINLERLKSGGYGILLQEDITLLKGQPIKLPTYVYGDDAGRSVNLIQKRLFQFTEQFIRLDDEYSAWSTYSKRNVPSDEPTPAIGTDVTKANNLIVSVDAGNDRVKTINVGARYDNLDWFLVKSVDRKDIVSLPNTTVDVSQEIYEAYDPATNIYSFAFYNDGLYNNIPVLETDLPYDYVPKRAGALEVINGSILTLGDLTEGENRPVVDVNLSVSVYDPQIENDPPVYDYLRVTKAYDDGNAGGHRRNVTIGYDGIAKTGDVFNVQLRDLRDFSVTQNYSYTVPITQNNDTISAINSFSIGIPNSNTTPFALYIKTDPYFELSYATVTLQNAGTGVSKSIHSIKLNSAYQLALAHYKGAGNYFPIVSDKRFMIKTPSYAQTHGFIPQISWQINSLPPAGAESAQWLISFNNTHATDLYINGALDAFLSNDDYLVFNITSLLRFNQVNSSSILSYDYSVGDRCTFMFTFTGSTSTPVKWFDAPAIDVEVVGLDIVVDTSVDPNTTKYNLKVRKSASINIADITGKEVLLEIYSPKKRTETNDGVTSETSTLFYEIGEQILIQNGDYTVKSGVIREADAYFKTRNLVSNIDVNIPYTFLVEDFNFSDFYKSNYYSYGRPRLYNDEQEETRKKASIRYSDTFITGSRVNGISRFYGERIYGDGAGETSSQFGAIGVLSQRDSYLVCIQELKLIHIPVNISILEDQAENQNVAISDKLLNKARYLQSGSFGIGTAKESFVKSRNGTIYFVDPNNSLPIRDGYNGVAPIAVKMSKFFMRVLQQAKKDGKKIYGLFDNYNEEYTIHIETLGGIVTSFKFNSSTWQYQFDFGIDPSTLLLVSSNHGSVVINTTTGQAVFTPETDYTGSVGFIFSFEIGENVIQSNVCGTITAGSTDVNSFFFIDLINQELSTVVISNSILIGGNTIPAPISITGGEYRINGGAWTNIAGNVNAGDTIEVRQTTSASYNTTTSSVLTVGGYSDSFDAKTKTDTEPDPFDFIDISDAELSTVYESNIVTITGLGAPSPTTITGGEYRINGGAYTSAAGNVSNGQTVQVRQTSSATEDTTTSTTLTIGGVDGIFNVNTGTTILIPDFDFLVARFLWDYPSAGSDLDIQVQFENNDTPTIDNIFVGFGNVDDTVLSGTTPESNAYLWWGLDDTNSSAAPQGIEGALVNILKFVTDFPSSPNIVEVGLYCVWYGSVASGDFTLEVVTYKGGTMSKVGTNIVNTGGVTVSSDTRLLNTTIHNSTHTPANSYKVGVIRYNKTTLTAEVIFT